jgi:hypothetical protein
LSLDASTILGGAPDIYSYDPKNHEKVPIEKINRQVLKSPDATVPQNKLKSPRQENLDDSKLSVALHSETSNFSIDSIQAPQDLRNFKTSNKNILYKLKDSEKESVFFNSDQVPISKKKNSENLKSDETSSISKNSTNSKHFRNILSSETEDSRISSLKNKVTKKETAQRSSVESLNVYLKQLDQSYDTNSLKDTSTTSSKFLHAIDKLMEEKNSNPNEHTNDKTKKNNAYSSNSNNQDDAIKSTSDFIIQMNKLMKEWSPDSSLNSVKNKIEETDNQTMYTVSQNSTLVSRSNSNVPKSIKKSQLSLNKTKTTMSPYSSTDSLSASDGLYMPNFSDFKDDSYYSCTKINSPHANKIRGLPIASSESSGLSSFSTIHRNTSPDIGPATGTIRPRSRTAMVLRELLGDPDKCSKQIKPDRDRPKSVEPSSTIQMIKDAPDIKPYNNNNLNDKNNDTTLNETIIESGCSVFKLLNKACLKIHKKKS